MFGNLPQYKVQLFSFGSTKVFGSQGKVNSKIVCLHLVHTISQSQPKVNGRCRKVALYTADGKYSCFPSATYRSTKVSGSQQKVNSENSMCTLSTYYFSKSTKSQREMQESFPVRSRWKRAVLRSSATQYGN